MNLWRWESRIFQLCLYNSAWRCLVYSSFTIFSFANILIQILLPLWLNLKFALNQIRAKFINHVKIKIKIVFQRIWSSSQIISFTPPQINDQVKSAIYFYEISKCQFCVNHGQLDFSFANSVSRIHNICEGIRAIKGPYQDL